ncbi:MAG: carbohydrate ABC transporter permease [Acutalibacteraceae bacterium]|jgi:multiple sugar transport system permease protein
MKLPKMFHASNSLAAKHRATQFASALFRYVLLIGLCFIILYPFLARISTMFMSTADINDPTVRYIPRHPSFNNIKYIFTNGKFGEAFLHTFLMSLISASLTTAMACCVGYGLSKFRLKGGMVVIVLVVFSILIPPQSIMIPMYSYFYYFMGLPGPVLTDTYWPIVMLSATGFSFRAGLFILVVWQFMKGVPDELLEAADVDGSGTARTFFQIIVPLSSTILVTVFLLSFCWQWTDTFYSTNLYVNIPVLANQVTQAGMYEGGTTYMSSVMTNTAVMVAIAPLIILYLFFQRYLVEGVERSGIVG